jgi:hypothetical protein
MGKRLTAQQIMDNYQPGDILRHQEPEEFWGYKLEEAKTNKISKDRTLYQDIEERGQQKPITLGYKGLGAPSILDGHHRLAALHHMNPNQFVKYRRVTP